MQKCGFLFRFLLVNWHNSISRPVIICINMILWNSFCCHFSLFNCIFTSCLLEWLLWVWWDLFWNHLPHSDLFCITFSLFSLLPWLKMSTHNNNYHHSFLWPRQQMNGKSIILINDLAACDLSYSCRKNSIKEEVEVIMRVGVQSTLQLS